MIVACDTPAAHAAASLAASAAAGASCALAVAAIGEAVGASCALFAAHPEAVWALPAAALCALALYRMLGVNAASGSASLARTVDERRVPRGRDAAAACAATCINLCAGASVGKEAAALQTGAALGAAVTKAAAALVRVSGPRTRREAAGGRGAQARARRSGVVRALGPDPSFGAVCGIAAAFSALFAAPVAGVAFAVEMGWARGVFAGVRRGGAPGARAASAVRAACLAVAAASAYGISHALLGFDAALSFELLQNMDSHAPAAPAQAAASAAAAGAVALAVGAAGALWTRALAGARALWRGSFVRACVCAVAAAGVVAAFTTAFGLAPYAGPGMDAARAALSGAVPAHDWAVKAALAFAALGFAVKGGEIMPTICIGALLGNACAQAAGLDAGAGAALGVTAMFAAAFRCPATAAVLGIELFGISFAPALAFSAAAAWAMQTGRGLFGR